MKSNITYNGLPQIPDFAGSLNYIYGLSDFWTYVFQDKELLDRTLETQAYQLADLYSRFLQQCSSISIYDIDSTFHRSTSLILINVEYDPILGIEVNYDPTTTSVYTLPEVYVNSVYLMDRPMLPRFTYEKEVHYNIINDGTLLETYKPLKDMGFPSTRVINGTKQYNQYAIWTTDVEVDEQSLFNYFGKFVSVSPETSSDLYKNFILGVMSLYVNGPTLTLLERGINLAIGIPYARQTETILTTFVDPESGNWHVVTPNNSYVIPYKIPSKYVAGDVVTEGQEVSDVCNIDDYITKEDWWLNINMPRALFSSPSFTNIAPAHFTASIVGTTMTVTAVTAPGVLYLGSVISGAGVTSGTRIHNQISGTTGGIGTYVVSVSQTVYSTAMQTQVRTTTPTRDPYSNDIDDYMKTFLKKHTFLVSIKVTTEFPTGSVDGLISLVTNSKPTYTTPIFVWLIPTFEDFLIGDDSDFVAGAGAVFSDSMIGGEYIYRSIDLPLQRSRTHWIKSNGNLTGYGGVTVVSTHVVNNGVTPSTTSTVNDDKLIPLYNLTANETSTLLTAIGHPISVGSLLDRFMVTGVDLVANYTTVTERQTYQVYPEPIGSTGHIGYNEIPLGNWTGEMERSFVPVIGHVTTSESLVFMKAIYSTPSIYSLFIYRAGGNTIFNPVYFPPNEGDPLTITVI